MRSRTSLVLSTTPISAEERCKSFPHARRLGILTLVSAALLCVATPVRAQDDHQLAGLLLDLLSESGRNSTTPEPDKSNGTIAHAMHFIPGLALQACTSGAEQGDRARTHDVPVAVLIRRLCIHDGSGDR